MINHFFQSILRNDILKARVLLNKLKQRIKTKENPQNINVYHSCLTVLLAHLLSNKYSLNIHNVKLIIDDFDINVPHEYNEDIKTKLIYCLLYSYINVENKPLKNSIAKYIQSILQKWNVVPRKFIDQISDNDLSATFAKITNIPHIPRPDMVPTNNVSIELYKSDGLLSFDKLCEYISTRYTKYDKSKALPMYELYDTLSPEEKPKFMQEYLEFNQEKQLNVESNCLDLVEDFRTQANSKLINVNKFKMTHSKLIYSWYDFNSTYLNSLVMRMNKPSFESKVPDELALLKYKVYLNLLPRRVIITLIISNLLSKLLSSESGHIKVTELANAIGSSFRRLMLRDSSFKDIKPYFMKFFHEEDSIILFTSLINIFIHNCKIPSTFIDHDSFTQSLQLLDMSQDIDSSFLKEEDSQYPAFLWGYLKDYDGPAYKKTGVIKIHPYLQQEFKSYDSYLASKSLYLPMLCPPKPWSSPVEGGYLKDLKPVINTEDQSTSLFYLNKAHKTGQLRSIYEGLDILGSLSWAVNSKVLKVFNEVMDYSKGFLKIPPNLNNLQIQLPVEPIQSNFNSFSDYNKAIWLHKIESGKVLQDFHAIKSQRIELKLIQRLANSYNSNGDVFYLPHNVDFRGRAYPMVSLLSHYQDDLVRSLLMFWNSKPLGPTGFDWLKYQLAGVYGQDKLPMNDRLKFIEDNLNLIIDSAQNPLNGQMWWKSGEKPWQTLSICIEINQIIEFSQIEGKKIEDYLCRIPIHQDGSCNGLQHYAALGADKEGGLSVNLLPLDSINSAKSDVYSRVLDLVKRQVLAHSQDPSHQYHELASLALTILNRKVVKQTVMTSVYGVTRHGATSQINMKIKDIIKNFGILLNDGKDIPLPQSEFLRLKTLNVEVSNYLASIVLNSISKLFSGAKLIQDWLLQNCFRIITSFDLATFESLAKVNGKQQYDFFNPQLFKPMMWTSMSGFPVIQLYKHTKQKALPTSLQSIVINKPSKIASIDVRKQLNAVAPNFIHSVDSIHMLMTCITANHNEIPFISVHDSFWTLPCDVDRLSKIIRKEFVRLHTSDIIENLRNDMMYTTRNSFQLVYIQNSENPKLLDKLNNMRAQYYNEPLKFTKVYYNKILHHELRIQTHKEEGVSTPLDLIELHKPKLYFRSKRSTNIVSLYEHDKDECPENSIKLTREFTPILVPVKILNKPPTGDLDINRVLDSVYFFS